MVEDGEDCHDAPEKFRLNFSRYTKHDTAPLIVLIG